MKKALLLCSLFLAASLSICAQDCEVTITGEDTYLCDAEETTTLTASPGFEHYYWSNGMEGMSVEVGVGFYKLHAVGADGCLAYTEYALVGNGYHKEPGYYYSVRYEDSLLLDAFYLMPYTIHETFSYSWVWEGDTISDENFAYIDTLGPLLDTFDVFFYRYLQCQEFTTGRSFQIQDFDTEVFADTLYVPSNFDEIHYGDRFLVPNPGLYKFVYITDFEFHVISYRYFQFLQEPHIIYDTVTWCGIPFEYGDQRINGPGSYGTIDLVSDTFAQLLLEVIPTDTFYYSFDTLSFCGEERYEYGGILYDPISRLYTNYVSNGEACDSIVFLQVTHLPDPDHTIIDTAICENDFFIWEDSIYAPGETYHLEYPLGFNCDSVVVLNVTSVPLNTSSLDTLICSGDTLRVNGQLYFETGNYTYYKESADDCDTLFNLSLEVNPPFSISEPFILPDDGSSSGAIFVNTSGGNPPYEILWSNSANTPNLVNLSAGVYTLSITDRNDCTAQYTFEVPLILSNTSEESAPTVQLLPNPVRDQLWVRLSEPFSGEDLSIYLFNAQGQSVWQAANIQDGESYIVDHLPDGAYTYLIRSAGSAVVETGALLKQ